MTFRPVRLNFSILPDSSFTSGNKTKKDFNATSRIQKNGVMTKSNVVIPAGTEYKVFSKLHNQDGSISFSVQYNLDGRIPHASDFTYANRDEAIQDGWNV